MTRRHWAIGVLTVWLLSLAWLAKRELFRSTGARLADAALSVPPGALFYRLDMGATQVGWVSATMDTLPDSIRVEDMFVLDVAAAGKLRRSTARSVALLSRTLRLQRVDVTFDGDFGEFVAHGRVLGDSVLRVSIVSEGDSQVTRIPLSGPITLPTLLPLRLAFGGELQQGRTYSARLFDPLLLAARDVTVRVAAESTLVVADSADLDSTTMVWGPEHFDTVRAFRIDQEVNGIRVSSWIDAQGRVVRASSPVGFTTERTAFEIAYENFRRRDTSRVARSSATPALGAIVPATALAARVNAAAGARDGPARFRVRLSGVDLKGFDQLLNGGRQQLVGDTLEITRESTLKFRAMPYRLPSRDTALARWLQPEPLIQSRDPRVVAQARLIVQSGQGGGGGRDRTPARAAELLTHWVHANVRRELTTSVASAEKVLETRRGDCNEFATLYVALARAAGLPSRTVSGLIYLNGRFYYHAWPEVYLGDWVAVDPTFDQYPADALHLRFAIGGLARQVDLFPLVGRLKLEVL
jgi:transglutaminase-like putative cysteine protease